MARKIILFFLIANVALVRSECDGYTTCIGTFITNFFNGANYFKNIKSDGGESDINNILGNVSSFLRDEWENNNTIVARNVFNADNDTSVFVRAIDIGDDIDFYNIFDENRTLISPEEFNIEKLALPENSSVIYETPRNSTFQPLGLNLSEILLPASYEFALPANASSIIYETITKNSTFQPLGLNLSEILVPASYEFALPVNASSIIYKTISKNSTFQPVLVKISEIPVNLSELVLPINASSMLYETITKNSTFQPLVFNFSEILAPVNFNTSAFPQIKIEHYQPERDQRENEIGDADFQEYYDFAEDNSTDYPIIDYIDLYKDTTNEIISTEPNDIGTVETETFEESLQVKKYEDKGDDDKEQVQDARAIFPWIAAIYIRNDTDDQYNYYCDGALLSNKTIVTAARCIRGTNYSVEANDIIVILGKNSLQTNNENETVAKVEDIFIHENFTNGTENDIAVLNLEDEVELCENIQPAHLGDEVEYDEAYTTGWAYTGELTAIHFQKDSNCDHYLQDNRTFCAAYGNEVSVCPSYGGLYAVHSNSSWYLRGVRTAAPTERALCINRPVVFTALEYYYPWLSQFV